MRAAEAAQGTADDDVPAVDDISIEPFDSGMGGDSHDHDHGGHDHDHGHDDPAREH